MPITKAEPGKTRVGWIGTGVMGRWMCQHLMDKGYKATVYNRTKDKAGPLLDAGAAWGATPKAVAEASDVVFAIVGFPKDVREVFLGPQGALAGSRAGAALVDMTSSEPSLARVRIGADETRHQAPYVIGSEKEHRHGERDWCDRRGRRACDRRSGHGAGRRLGFGRVAGERHPRYQQRFERLPERHRVEQLQRHGIAIERLRRVDDVRHLVL